MILMGTNIPERFYFMKKLPFGKTITSCFEFLKTVLVSRS